MLGLPPFRRPPRVPEPGQCVGLRLEDGSWRHGFRAVSRPTADEKGEVMIRVSTEDEYRAARWEDRPPVGMPWPARGVSVSEKPAWNLRPEIG